MGLRMATAPRAGFKRQVAGSCFLHFSPFRGPSPLRSGFGHAKAGLLGAPMSGGVSHKMDALSNRRGVRGVRGEEILSSGGNVSCHLSVVRGGFAKPPWPEGFSGEHRTSNIERRTPKSEPLASLCSGASAGQATGAGKNPSPRLHVFWVTATTGALKPVLKQALSPNIS